jgi:hypothetical protein
MLSLEKKLASSSCKTIVVCADVEVSEHKGKVAVVEDGMLKIVVVDIVVIRLSRLRLSHMKPQVQKRCHGDDRDVSR